MERNENGYPTPRSGAGCNGCPRCSGGQGGGANGIDMGCGPIMGADLGDRPLAYAYVPIQRWQMLYPADGALAHGTLFEELYKPLGVYGNE